MVMAVSRAASCIRSFFGVRGLDASRAARGVEASQALVADRSDHGGTVACCATRYSALRERALAPRLQAMSKQELEMARILSIRHVPDEVAKRLQQLASRAGVPLSTFALQG